MLFGEKHELQRQNQLALLEVKVALTGVLCMSASEILHIHMMSVCLCVCVFVCVSLETKITLVAMYVCMRVYCMFALYS